jgi:hypothetical protein
MLIKDQELLVIVCNHFKFLEKLPELAGLNKNVRKVALFSRQLLPALSIILEGKTPW